MSVVADQVRRLDALLDRTLSLPSGGLGTLADAEAAAEQDHEVISLYSVATTSGATSPQVNELLRIVRALSTESAAVLLPPWRIKLLLSQSGIAVESPEVRAEDAEEKTQLESELEWLVVSKATIHVYGLVLNTLLDQIIPLHNDIWYWDDVLSSYTYSSLYTIQTSPLRLWQLTKEVYEESKERFTHSPAVMMDSTRAGLAQQWRQFYAVVRDSIRERSIASIQRKILSPIALARVEARENQAQLRRLREITASGLGILVLDGLDFTLALTQDGASVKDKDGWKVVVERSIALMDMILRDGQYLERKVTDFENAVYDGVNNDSEFSVLDDVSNAERPRLLALRLERLLDRGIPDHGLATRKLVAKNGRPSIAVRYWLPLSLALLSSTTLARILVHRKAEILAWVTDLAYTARDFWFNWVVEPVGKIIRTIRHDANSEIALMSRDSLKADRESLERMVVDFAVDKPHFTGHHGGSNLSEAQIAEIRAKVSEGDVTPVLRAYEQDLRSPFLGAVRGDLVRSLLIQVQKTKVDLEVAIGGIDALLKSQELVFGFVGLTPGILVLVGLVQYLRGALGQRSGTRHSRRAGKAMRVLRNVDCILTSADAPGPLQYKDYGLLLCEVHMLRNLARGLMPRDVEREFLEDLDELTTTRGVERQAVVAERIRWAYARWIR